MLYLSLPLPVLRAVRMVVLNMAFTGRKMGVEGSSCDNEVVGGKSSPGPYLAAFNIALVHKHASIWLDAASGVWSSECVPGS